MGSTSSRTWSTSASVTGAQRPATQTRTRTSGVDLFYNVTPGLRANLTVNTDFAQAEVDQRQTNLTRFSLFFPEKRDFFLDGSTVLQLCGRRRWRRRWRRASRRPRAVFQPAHRSRRTRNAAGDQLRQESSPARPGPSTSACLHVQTREDRRRLGEDFSVMRLKRRCFRQSYIGAIYTRRAARGFDAADRHTAGVDFELATSTFLGSQNLVMNGFSRQGSPSAPSGKDAAIGSAARYPNDPFDAQMNSARCRHNYDAAVGFTRRIGVPRVIRGSRSPCAPTTPRIRRSTSAPAPTSSSIRTPNDALENEIDVTRSRWNCTRRTRFRWVSLPTYERLDRGLPDPPGVTLPRRQRVPASPATAWRLETAGRGCSR